MNVLLIFMEHYTGKQGSKQERERISRCLNGGENFPADFGCERQSCACFNQYKCNPCLFKRQSQVLIHQRSENDLLLPFPCIYDRGVNHGGFLANSLGPVFPAMNRSRPQELPEGYDGRPFGCGVNREGFKDRQSSDQRR